MARQGGGILPPGGAMPISRALAAGASASEATTGMPPAHAEKLLRSLARRLPVQHRHDFLGLVADHVDRRLGRMGIVVAVDEDNEPASMGK